MQPQWRPLARHISDRTVIFPHACLNLYPLGRKAATAHVSQAGVRGVGGWAAVGSSMGFE